MRLEVKVDGMSANTIISDLSLSGCYIIALPTVMRGELLSFHVKLPTNRWMPLLGEVMYQHPNIGFGVQFRDMKTPQKVIIKKLLEGELARSATRSPNGHQVFKTARAAA
jgi:hypothetical protein